MLWGLFLLSNGRNQIFLGFNFISSNSVMKSAPIGGLKAIIVQSLMLGAFKINSSTLLKIIFIPFSRND
jgi:hypothetical protein